MLKINIQLFAEPEVEVNETRTKCTWKLSQN